MKIEHFAFISKGLETMGETFWYDKRLMIFGSKQFSMPLAKSG
jgi:hypothetical protein